MSLIVYAAVAAIAAGLALALRTRPRAVAVVGLLGLCATSAAAFAIEPGQLIDVAGTGIATTSYLRHLLIVSSLVGLGLGIQGLAAGTRRDAPATTMLILAAGGLTLGLRDPQAAVIVATAGGLFGVLVTVVRGGGPAGANIGIREARVVVVAGVLAIFATAWFGRDLDGSTAQPVLLGAAYVAFTLAVAMRFGIIPFHLWAARLADTVPETALPFLTAIAPATLAVVALAWTEAMVSPALVDLGPAKALIETIAIVSIVLAAVAAFVQDDVEHVLGYSIVGDAGILILALGSLEPTVWTPARTWILVFIASRSAFAAWVAGIRAGFWTGSVADLRGWARRSPLLGAALVAIVFASIGLPGLAAFEARTMIVDLAVDGPLTALVLLGTLAPIAYYGRLLVIGLDVPERVGFAVEAWRPRLTPIDRTDLPGWLRSTGHANRAFGAAAVAVLLAGLAVATSVGTFGGPADAAGRPPALERSLPAASPST